MKPYIIGAHSLGAGRGTLLAGMGAVAGQPAAALVNCGEPRPCFQRCCDIVAKAGTAITSLLNCDPEGHDVVTDVPFHIPPAFAYEHSFGDKGSLLRVSESPPANDRTFYRYHHSYLYAAALAKMPPWALPHGTTVQTVITLVDAIYGVSAVKVTWDHFDDGTDSDGVCWAIKSLDDCDLLILRGSKTLQDWLRDFACCPTPWGDAQLGPVHSGFLLGMRQVWNEFCTMRGTA